jgi:transglutaminase-like putative cysteine protease
MLKILRLQEGWLTVGLLALLLFSVTLSIQQAQWSDGLSILTPITIVGLATGIILAKARGVPRFLLDLVGLEVGVVTILLSVASVMHDPRLLTVQDRVQDLLGRTVAWIGIAMRQEMSDDLIVFILSLAVVSWVLAYSSAYFVFRSRQLWWALVPNGVALLINLSYSQYNLNGFIVVFMLSALLLMVRFNLLLKEERWQRERVNYSPTLTWAFLWAGGATALLLAGGMWYVPATAVNSTLNKMWESVNQPWVDFQNSMSRLWAQVPGNQSIGGYSSFNKSFTMGGALNLSDSVALVVKSNERHYWRAATYDQYTGIGWRNTAAETFNVQGLSPRLALEADQQLRSSDAARQEVTYTVQVVNPKLDMLFASQRTVRLTLPSRLDVSWRDLNDVYNIDLLYPPGGPPQLKSVPLELLDLVGALHVAEYEMRQSAIQNPELNTQNSSDPQLLLSLTSQFGKINNDIDDLSKRGITAVYDLSPGPNYSIDLRASGQVPVYDDITALHADGTVPRGQQYSVISMVSKATADEIRSAGTDYEDWVRQRYLSIPATVPQSVRDLAVKVLTDAGATTPYDMAKALESYLRKNYQYNINIPQPPAGIDRVEWFLFQGKEGYCEYYASAMIVMLRSLGVPSRMATGYAPGTYDSKSQSYIVRESAAHAWPEVYFPGYGWEEFEPTPSQAVIAHDINGTTMGVDPSPVPSPSVSGSPKDTDLPSSAHPEDGGKAVPIPGHFTLNVGPWTLDFGLWTPGFWAALILVALAVVAALLWLRIIPWRKSREPATAGRYYARMLLWSRLLRAAPSVHQTPYEYSEALAREFPGTSLFTRAIVRAYVRERFSRDGLGLSERVSVRRAWDSLRARMWRRVPGRQLGRIAPKRRA